MSDHPPPQDFYRDSKERKRKMGEQRRFIFIQLKIRNLEIRKSAKFQVGRSAGAEAEGAKGEGTRVLRLQRREDRGRQRFNGKFIFDRSVFILL